MTIAKISPKKKQILTTSAHLLATKGGVNFSMRTVAEEMGIRLSNLQYYFPTLEKLFTALVENILLMVERKITSALKSDAEPMRILIDIVCSELDDVYNCQLMWEIWALSERTEEAHQAIALFYQEYLKKIATLIHIQNPKLNSDNIQRRALIIVSLLEGVWVVIGKKRPNIELDKIKADLQHTIDLIINSSC